MQNSFVTNLSLSVSLAVVSLVGNAPAVFAWGDVGHMTVCDLAMTQVTPVTKAAVMKITGDQPMNLQCVWPDQVKRLGDWFYTANYHFINYDDGSSWEPTDRIKTKDGQVRTFENVGDMLQMVERAKDKLKDNATNPKQQLCYLRFLGHLAGDTHQPLHAGRAVDFGGNAIKVTFNGDPLYRLRIFPLNVKKDEAGKIIESECSKQIFTPSLQCMMTQALTEKKSDGSMGPIQNNLHVLWDDAFIDQRLKEIGAFPPEKFESRETPDAAKAYFKELSAGFAARSSELHSSMNDDPLKWVEQTNQFRSLAYSTQGIEDSSAYYNARYPIVADQITRAGYHLAGTLNMIFDPNWRFNPYVKEYMAKRKLEFDARVKSGRTTEFKTECDKL